MMMSMMMSLVGLISRSFFVFGFVLFVKTFLNLLLAVPYPHPRCGFFFGRFPLLLWPVGRFGSGCHNRAVVLVSWSVSQSATVGWFGLVWFGVAEKALGTYLLLQNPVLERQPAGRACLSQKLS